MLPDELESVAARHVPGRGKVDIHRLSEGLVNETYKVLRDGSAYVLRVAAPGHRDLGTGEDLERHALVAEPLVELVDQARDRFGPIRVFPADVRRCDHRARTRGSGSARERERILERRWAVVNAWQDVAMEVDHGRG